MGYPEVRRIKGSSNTFISKFPVIASEIIDQSPDASLSAWYDVVVNADTIRVLMVYLSSNQITAASEELLTTRKFQNSDTWKRGLGLVRSYLSKSHIRARQSQKIREVIEQSRHPVIIGGDLNDIPLSFAAHTITNGMQDAFRIKGFGFGTTYAGSIPGLRIDYILTDHNFEILNYVKRKVEASDHYPVVTAIRIKDL